MPQTFVRNFLVSLQAIQQYSLLRMEFYRMLHNCQYSLSFSRMSVLKPFWYLSRLWHVTLTLKQVIDLAKCHFLIEVLRQSCAKVLHIWKSACAHCIQRKDKIQHEGKILKEIKLNQNMCLFIWQTHKGPELATVIMVLQCSLLHIFIGFIKIMFKAWL